MRSLEVFRGIAWRTYPTFSSWSISSALNLGANGLQSRARFQLTHFAQMFLVGSVHLHLLACQLPWSKLEPWRWLWQVATPDSEIIRIDLFPLALLYLRLRSVNLHYSWWEVGGRKGSERWRKDHPVSFRKALLLPRCQRRIMAYEKEGLNQFKNLSLLPATSWRKWELLDTWHDNYLLPLNTWYFSWYHS